MTQDDGRNPVGDVFEALGTAIDERIERMRRPFFGPEDEPGFFEWLTTEAIPSLARTFDFASPTLEVTQIVLLAADHLDRIGKGEAATAVREGREPSWEALIDPTDLSGDPTTRRAIQSELVPGDQAQRHPVAFRELAQLEAIAAKIAALPEGHPDRATLLREHQVSLQLARGGHVTIRDDNGRPIPLLDHLATIESAVDAAALDRAGEVPFQQVHYFDTVDQQQVRLLTRTRTEGGGAVTEVSLSGADWQIRDDQRYRPLDEDPSLDRTRRSQLLYDSDGREVPSTMATLPDGTIVVGVGGQWVDFAASGLSFEKPVSAAATDAQATQDRWELLQTAIGHAKTHLDDLGAATKLDVLQTPVDAARVALAQTVGAFRARGLTPTQDEVFSVFAAIASAAALDTDARTRLANSFQRMFADPEAALEVNGPFLPELTTRGVNVAGVADALAQGVEAGAYSVDDALVLLDTTGRVATALIGPEGFTDLGVDYDRYIQLQAQAVASGQVSPQDAQQDLLGLAQVVATAQQRKRDDASQRGQFAFQVEQENRRRQDDLRRERQALTQQAQAQEMDFLNFVLRTAQAGMLPGLTRGVPADLAGARDLAQRAGVTVDTPAAIAGGPLAWPDFSAGMEGAWADWAAAEAAPPLTVEGLQQGGPAP